MFVTLLTNLSRSKAIPNRAKPVASSSNAPELRRSARVSAVTAPVDPHNSPTPDAEELCDLPFFLRLVR
jgi:hypothetical protein